MLSVAEASRRLVNRRGISCKLELTVTVPAIELTARQTKTQPGFTDLRDFNFMAFIENNTQQLVAIGIVSPTCQQPSFFKQFLINALKKILIKENGKQLNYASKPI